MRESLYDYCIRTGNRVLLREWDTTRNGDVTPHTISYGSKTRAWWTCAHGHTWQSSVTTRTANNSSCPYCAGKRAWPGENDLATCYPEIAAEWDLEKNGALRPQDVLPGSCKNVWWKCINGHVWQSMVKSRVHGCGCPICANRKAAAHENSLAATHPALAAEWYQPKNHALTPYDVVSGSKRKVWWKCTNGHIWQASIVFRAHNGTGCPVCAGRTVVPGENDLASRYPQIAAEWDMEKNAPLTPDQVSPYSNYKVWWKCALGHTWKAAVCTRTHAASSCPYCSGRLVLSGFNDLATLVPEVAAQWHPTLNGELTPQMVTPGSKKRVWWICPEGHVWRAVVGSRAGAQRCGCPICAGKIKSIRQNRYAQIIAERHISDAAHRV